MEESNGKRPSLTWAILTFGVSIGVILVGIVFLGIRPPVLPLIGAVIAGAIMCMIGGAKWDDLEKGMFDALGRVQIAVVLLILIGMLIPAWVACGTIPAIMYWGLKLISPEHFLVSCAVLCTISSLATGTSTAAIGTIGIALLGIGTVMGYNPAPVAGAIITGAFCGDKMSPISDTTNLASSLCNVPLFQHIYSMLFTTVPALLISLIVYFILGYAYSSSMETPMDNINLFLETISTHFSLSWYVFIPPVLLLVLALKKISVLPIMIICTAAALVICLFHGETFTDIVRFLFAGYKKTTGVAEVDKLMTDGGIGNMMVIVLMLLSGVAFGGVLERGRVFEVIIDALLKGAKSSFRLIASSIAAGFIVNLGTGVQILAVVMPARAFAKAYKEADVHPAVLSRSCEDTGTVTAPIIPWSAQAFFIYGVLKVSAWDYAPYAILCWVEPLIALLLAATGFAIWDRKGKAQRGRSKIGPVKEAQQEA